jgi:hypothetical protein
MTTGMRYQKVLWHHDPPDEPVVLYAKISSGREVRQVEIFRDDRHDYADTSGSTGTTMLSEILTPADDEINQDPQPALHTRRRETPSAHNRGPEKI